MVVGWATGHLPEPPNNPQVGMQNMRTIMPALQRARPVAVESGAVTYREGEGPEQRRDTRIVKDIPVDEMAREIVDWLRS